MDLATTVNVQTTDRVKQLEAEVAHLNAILDTVYVSVDLDTDPDDVEYVAYPTHMGPAHSRGFRPYRHQELIASRVGPDLNEIEPPDF